jgi:hypothetical protein
MEEMTQAIDKLKLRKTPGQNEITAEMIKYKWKTNRRKATKERKGNSFMFYRFKKGLRQNKKKRYLEVHVTKRSGNKYDSNVTIIEALYKNNRNKIGMYNQESAEFEGKIGLKPGCVLNPLLFSIVQHFKEM